MSTVDRMGASHYLIRLWDRRSETTLRQRTIAFVPGGEYVVTSSIYFKIGRVTERGEMGKMDMTKYSGRQKYLELGTQIHAYKREGILELD